jgi:AcrR family transcriptional regulator
MNETGNRLVEAARTCLRAGGVGAATSRAITDAAGANLAAIGYHFGSKDRLVAEALVSSLRQWLEPAIAVLRSDGDPSQRTALAIQTLVQTFSDHRADAPVYLEALVQSPRLPELSAALAQLLADLRETMTAQIVEMRDRGELPDWVEPNAMASLILAVANGLVLQVTIDGTSPPLAAMAAQFGALLQSARLPAGR